MENNYDEKLVKKLKDNGLTDRGKLEKVLDAMEDLINIKTFGYYRSTLYTFAKCILQTYARAEAKAERTVISDELRNEYGVFCKSYKNCDECPYCDYSDNCYAIFCYNKGKKEK